MPGSNLCLPPYSPDLDPIEEFFAELKKFIKLNWETHAESQQQDIGAFLEWCVDVVGKRESSAKGHFRHAGLAIHSTVRSTVLVISVINISLLTRMVAVLARYGIAHCTRVLALSE